MLYNKRVEVPLIPIYDGPGDTRNFEKYSDEDSTIICNDVDQTYFDGF